jgi:hypothetical protein
MIPLPEIGKALRGSAVPASPQASARGICKGFVRALQLQAIARGSSLGVKRAGRVPDKEAKHGGER